MVKKEFVRIYLDDSFPAIFEEWTGQVSSQEFQEALEEKLAQYKTHKKELPGLEWLNDIRQLRVGDEAGLKWAAREFHPKLYGAGVRKIAFLVPEQVYYELPPEDLLGRKDSKGEILVCYFDSYEAAGNWLKTGFHQHARALGS